MGDYWENIMTEFVCMDSIVLTRDNVNSKQQQLEL